MRERTFTYTIVVEVHSRVPSDSGTSVGTVIGANGDTLDRTHVNASTLRHIKAAFPKKWGFLSLVGLLAEESPLGSSERPYQLRLRFSPPYMRNYIRRR